MLVKLFALSIADRRVGQTWQPALTMTSLLLASAEISR